VIESFLVSASAWRRRKHKNSFKIIGGIKVIDAAKYPDQVAVVKGGKASGFIWNENYVVTAGHVAVMRTRNFLVWAGTNNDDDSVTRQRREVKDIYVHPDYNE